MAAGEAVEVANPSSGGGRRTDGDGRAKLVAIAGIPVRVSLMDHDVTPTTVVAPSPPTRSSTSRFVELLPRPRLDVESVVDARGPVPFARLAVHTRPRCRRGTSSTASCG
jgi:hypothetical protein